MGDKLARWAALCLLLLLLPMRAWATEDVSAEPTRNPNAPPYSSDHPEELEKDNLVADSFVLMERSTKELLFYKDENKAQYPASTTKIMTALIALEMGGDLDETLEVSERAVDMPSDASVVPFKAGEIVTLRDALYGLMLVSGNDAAIAIAEYISGDVETFVELMNKTAARLGCKDTNFENPHGLHEDLHVTTAYDLALIMDAAMENEMFREIISTVTYDLSATLKNPSRKLTTLNLQIQPSNTDYYYKYSLGGKTGNHSMAARVLVESAEKDGVELIAVIMKSNKYAQWSDTSRLFEYGFSKYKSVTPEEIYAQSPMSLQINGFEPDTERADLAVINAGLAQGETKLKVGELRLDLQPVDATRVVRITGLIETVDAMMANFSKYTDIQWLVEPRAPVRSGQVMGVLTFYTDDGGEAEYQLVATRSIVERVDAPPTLEEIERRVLEDPSIFPPFDLDWVVPPVAAMLAAVLVLRAMLRRLLRRRKGKKQIPKPKRRYFG